MALPMTVYKDGLHVSTLRNEAKILIRYFIIQNNLIWITSTQYFQSMAINYASFPLKYQVTPLLHLLLFYSTVIKFNYL